MPIPDEIYRDAYRRLHRVIANFFAVKAWCLGANCVILDRKVLNELLSLERIKGIREQWIEEDMQRWFPNIHWLNYVEKASVSSLYLSRVPIDEWDVQRNFGHATRRDDDQGWCQDDCIR